jgi:hypothetical protein
MTVDDEILACEAQLREAQLTGDVAVLDRLLDDLLLFTNIDGTLANKDDDLSLHRSGRLRIVRMDPGDRHLLHLGETSVVSVRMNAEAIMNGVPVSATRVAVGRGTYEHSTRMRGFSTSLTPIYTDARDTCRCARYCGRESIAR